MPLFICTSLCIGRYIKTYYPPLKKGKIVFAILSGIFGLASLFPHVKYFSLCKKPDINFTALVNSHSNADSSCNSTKGEATTYLKVRKYLK